MVNILKWGNGGGGSNAPCTCGCVCVCDCLCGCYMGETIIDLSSIEEGMSRWLLKIE